MNVGGVNVMALLCRAHGIPEPTPEYRFHSRRKWRFDFAWVAELVALEIEGGAWTGGRHTRGKGFLADIEKYNAAVVLGWSVLRCTPQMVESGEIFETLRKVL